MAAAAARAPRTRPVTSSGGTLELWVWDQLATIADFTAALDYPPGYLQAIIYNLAVMIAPNFERPLDPGVKNEADRALLALGTTNASQHHMPPAAAPPPGGNA